MIEVESDVALSSWCTMNVGGPAHWFVRTRSQGEVLDALAWADARRAPVLVLGGGSNILIADEGFVGVVVQVGIPGVEMRDEGSTVVFSTGAGEAWDPLVAQTIDENCAGLECLSGIPGLVGGTPIQNVGAYGQDVSGTIRSVRVIDRQARQPRTMPAHECGFGYRTSRFRHADAGRFVVTGVDFALARHGPATITYADVVTHFAERPHHERTLQAVRQAIIEIRSRKGMVIREGNPANQSCGSFFVNPVITPAQLKTIGDAPHYPAGETHVKVPAAWLIERAGFSKGYIHGSVGISPFQAQGLINRGGATADDVVGLASAVKRAVWERFAVALVPEPVFVGFDDDPRVAWLLDPAPNR